MESESYDFVWENLDANEILQVLRNTLLEHFEFDTLYETKSTQIRSGASPFPPNAL